MRICRKTTVLGLVASLLLVTVVAGPVVGDDHDGTTPRGPFAIKAKRVYDLTGATGHVVDGWVEVNDGRIVRVGRGPVPDDLDVVDLGDASLLPGFVNVNDSARRTDSGRQGAQYVAADNFDPFAKRHAAWQRGVTVQRYGPPVGSFVAGIASLIELGSDGDAEVLRRESDLVIDFTTRNAPPDGDVMFPSSSDVDIIPGRAARPNSRLGRLAALKELVALAKAHKNAKGYHKDAGEYDWRLEALAKFLDRSRPVAIRSERAAEIALAARAARELKLDCFLLGAEEVASVAAEVAAAQIPVVFTMPTDVETLGGDEFDAVAPLRHDVSGPAKLVRQGVRVALTGSNSDLLLAAQMAVRGGLDPVEALKAITLRPAEILGIADQVGSLAPGRRAHFAVVAGDPLDAATHVQSVWVAGKRKWTPQIKAPESLVVRAGKIHDGHGHVFDNGEILVQDGKIVACGSSVPRTANTKVLDLGDDAVVTPGFVDTHGHLGLEGDRSRVKPQFDLAGVFAVAHREFDAVARSGVTTVVVAPRSTSMAGVQMTAIKTAGVGRDALVTKDLVGMKMSVGGDRRSAKASFDGFLKRAKKYDDDWKKYAAALVKWKAEQAKAKSGAAASKTAEKVEKKPADDKKKKPEASDPVTGTWEVEFKGELPLPPGEDMPTMKLMLTLGKDKKTITGRAEAEGESEAAEIRGTLAGKNVELKIVSENAPPGMEIVLTATLDAPDHMAGSLSLGGMMEIDVEATRTEKKAPTITVKKSSRKKGPTKGPKKPKSNPGLEPFRKVFAGEATLMVQVSSADAAVAVTEVLAARKIDGSLLGADGFSKVHGELAGKVGVVLGTSLYRSDADRESPLAGEPYVGEIPRVLKAAELERSEVAMAFQSAGEARAKRILRYARAAVRAGLSKTSALKALTSGAARMTGLGKVAGSLRPGCDGDFLVFDGDPFEFTTNLDSVYIRGKKVK